MDRTSELQAAIDAGQVDFANETYEISSQINVPTGARIENLKIVVTAWDATFVALNVADASGIHFENIEINIGTDGSLGSLLGSSAFRLGSSAAPSLRPYVKNIRVTGAGKGTMIRVENWQDGVIEDVYVHDCYWTGTATIEQIVGLWLINCVGTAVNRPRVANLPNGLGGRAWQTDGITLSGCTAVKLLNGHVSKTGEGIDVSGSNVNSMILIDGFTVEDADSFGIKLANTAQRCLVTNCYVRRAGYASYIISGQSEAGNPNVCGSNRIYNNFSADVTVGNSNWTAQNTAHAIIMAGTYLPGWPTSNIIDNLNTGGGSTCKYGAVTQVSGNTLRQLNGNDWSVAGTLGTWLS